MSGPHIALVAAGFVILVLLVLFGTEWLVGYVKDKERKR